MARLLSHLRVNPNAPIDVDQVPASSGERIAPLDLANESAVAYWCGHYAISETALRTAAGAVGLMPAALSAYFSSRGGSTRIVSAEMRAAPATRRKRVAKRWLESP